MVTLLSPEPGHLRRRGGTLFPGRDLQRDELLVTPFVAGAGILGLAIGFDSKVIEIPFPNRTLYWGNEMDPSGLIKEGKKG